MKSLALSQAQLRSSQITLRHVYRGVSLCLAVVFAVVGLDFLFNADGVLTMLNGLSPMVGLPTAPVQGYDLFLVLSVGYMYMVTMLAVLMYRQPENRYFSFLLFNAKAASAVLAVALFFAHQPYLMYIGNGVVDGLIAILVIVLHVKMRGARG